MAGAARQMLKYSQPLPLTIWRGAVPRSGSLARLIALWERWRSRMAVRRELAQLSDRQLCDIGLQRDALSAEMAKPFWRD